MAKIVAVRLWSWSRRAAVRMALCGKLLIIRMKIAPLAAGRCRCFRPCRTAPQHRAKGAELSRGNLLGEEVYDPANSADWRPKFFMLPIFFRSCDRASGWFRWRPNTQARGGSSRVRRGQVRAGSVVRRIAGGPSEKLSQSFARLQSEEFDRHAFEEMAHDAAAHIAEANGGSDRRAYVDVDSGA